MDLVIDSFICGRDNYGVLIHDQSSGQTAAIDAPDGDAILARLEQRGRGLDLLLITHHHSDHTAGNLVLKKATGCLIIGPAKEADRIPGIDRSVSGEENVTLGEHRFKVIETPGHTTGHVCYWSREQELAFVGDTLFSLGCGRVFEEPLPTMWHSLDKLAQLPRETQVYCGHEYTEANGRFAISIEPNNLDLQARVSEVRRLSAGGGMTLPTTIGQERATNPFLRADKPRLKRALGMADAAPAEVFSELRRRKDTFA